MVWALEDNPARAFYSALGGESAEKRRLNIGGVDVSEQCFRWPSIAGDLKAEGPEPGVAPAKGLSRH